MKTATIGKHNGVPVLFIDGKPHSAFAYMSFDPQKKYIHDFAESGIELFSFSTSPDYDYLKLSNDGCPAPGQYSYKDFDARMQMILHACPNAKIFPRLFMCSPPWWDKEHPDELMRGVNGIYDPVPDFGFLPKDVSEADIGFAKMTVPSFSSKKWLDFSDGALRRLLQYAEEKYGDSIIGYLICSGGTQEWYYWGAFEDTFPDCSRPQQEAFHTWLDQRGIPCGENPIPAIDVRKGAEAGIFRDPSSDCGRLAIEYWKFHAWAIASAMGRFCKSTREIIGSEKIIGVFYGYFVDLQRQTNCWHHSGHLAFRQMSLDPNIDFVTSPTSYKDRKMGGFSIFNSLTESLAHHGKLWWDENDILTPLASVCKGDLFYMPATMAESRHIQLREFANVLCHGSSMWWFDMYAGWFDDPQTMSDIAAMVQIDRKALSVDRSVSAEVAVILDDDSVCYTQCTNRLTVPLVTDQLMELGHTGVPFSMIHVDDIDEIKPYKVYMFLNVFHVNDSRLGKILSCIRKPGITSIFVFAPGIVDAGVSVENATKLSGIDLALDYTGQAIQVRTLEKPGQGCVIYGPETTLSPLVYSVDAGAEVLGIVAGTSRQGLVRKQVGEASSVFSSAPCIPADILRKLFCTAGCLIFADSGEIVYANKSFISVCGLPQKKALLRLSPDSIVFDLFNEMEFSIINGSAELPPSETGIWVFFRGSRAEWEKIPSESQL
jgi:hypothetical protein